MAVAGVVRPLVTGRVLHETVVEPEEEQEAVVHMGRLRDLYLYFAAITQAVEVEAVEVVAAVVLFEG